MNPKIFKGDCFTDERGIIRYNNCVDFGQIRRFYEIENSSVDYIRGWNGHKVEQRWFMVSFGEIEVNIVSIENIEKNDFTNNVLSYTLNAKSKDILYVPPGYATSIKQKSVGAKIIAMSDYLMGELDDNLKWQLKDNKYD